MNQKLISVLLLLVFIFPDFVYAHGGLPGVNSGYNGFLHPLFVPAQILALLSLGILLGQQNQYFLKVSILSFLISCTIGMVLTLLDKNIKMDSHLLILSIGMGLLIAIDYKFSLRLYVFLAIMSGLSLGLDSEHQDLSGKEKYYTLMGCWVGLWACLSAVLIFTEKMKNKEWQRIFLRIIGSWVAASSVLVISLLFFDKN